MPIDATVFPAQTVLDEDGEPVGVEFEDVDFVSFVNASTYGKPAIIAPGPDHVSASNGPVTVLFINNSLALASEVTKR